MKAIGYFKKMNKSIVRRLEFLEERSAWSTSREARSQGRSDALQKCRNTGEISGHS